jgi:hypothetical protein
MDGDESRNDLLTEAIETAAASLSAGAEPVPLLIPTAGATGKSSSSRTRAFLVPRRRWVSSYAQRQAMRAVRWFTSR